ncbi:hypothetical protein TCE0_033f09105 [Talaromyces pinophilus]|uniref:Sulfatase N-terminal domain-containing protein n=1 Tax=Talaromyces pinophilus TaxID=128442 RepID=A0A6V8HBS3_TALPI|nr:hypothetical protein TCE0_033f09105 [Talaromyces pinophilus]
MKMASVRSFAYIPPPIPFYYPLLIISCLASKFLHLALHWRSVSPVYSVVYLPTFFFQDALVIILGRALLRGFDGFVQQICCISGCSITIVTWGASAIQIGFFLETGSQVEWGASSSFLRDPAATKILFSGTKTVCMVGAILSVVSVLATPYLHTIAGNVLQSACRVIIKSRGVLPPYTKSPSKCPNYRVLLPIIILGLYLLCARLTRPDVPYNHLSSTLPFSLSSAFQKPSEHCHPRQHPQYPFPQFISPDKWLAPSGYFPGWAPGRHSSSASTRPEWMPDDPPPGFERWFTDAQRQERYDIGGKGGRQRECMRKHELYDAMTDPAKISNLREPVHPRLKGVFDQGSVQIEHIVMLVLESARKDVFPMKEGSFLYDTIVNYHDDQGRQAVIDKLSRMTPTAQMVTREYATNSSGKRMTFGNDTIEWVDKIPLSMGGINVKGALTASSLTLKSLLSLHCGVMPLPVDMLEESLLEVYQPCLPHILSLFNSKKTVEEQQSAYDELRPVQERPWKSVFIQSSTDDYDRQSDLIEQLGFDEKIVKETIEDPSATYYPPKTREINYFGYPQEEIDPYIKDLIFDAAENKTRLFLSHMTLTSHHPWNFPKTFERENYFDWWSHRDLNAFLNTVRYMDSWVGRVLGYLEEAGIADRSLVVVVGDHGQAFDEDDGLQGTFENSHISNFRIPLVFRHPHLPYIDIEANLTTGMSVLPTVLDLLIESASLNEADTKIAKSLIHEYQGQSLLRPFISRDQTGRRVWNLATINAGGSILAIMSADLPYRLVVPIINKSQDHRNQQSDNETGGEGSFEYRFTHTQADPNEQQALERWKFADLRQAVRDEYGDEAGEWIEEARRMVRWWIAEQMRIWNY